MATLPDLDTNNIGYIAFWNFKDNMASTFDPATALNSPRLISYTLYDNGWEGEFEIGTWSDSVSVSNPTATARVKNDGWVIVYVDRTNEHLDTGTDAHDFDRTDDTVASFPDGYYNLAYNLNAGGNVGTPYHNSFQEAIRDLASNLDNWQSNDWNYSDVGIYNYEYSNASATTIVGYQQDTYSVGFTSGTNIHYASIASLSDTLDVNGSNQISTGLNMVTFDFLSNALLDQAEKEYQVFTGRDEQAIVTMWS